METLLEKHVHRTERRLDAGTVAVVEHGNVLGVATHQSHLLDSE